MLRPSSPWRALSSPGLRVGADHLFITDQPTRTGRGLALIQLPPFTDFRYGDRVRAEGTRSVQTPANTGDLTTVSTSPARMCIRSSRPRVTVLARDQGFAPLGWLYAFKAHAKNVIAQTLRMPEPQASLRTGILSGDEIGISKSVRQKR